MQRSLALPVMGMIVLVFASSISAGEPSVGSLLQSLDTINFEIVLGRITAQAARYRQIPAAARRNAPGSENESLAVNIHGGIPTLHYHFHDKNQQLTVDVIDGCEVEIHLTPSANSQVTPVHYVQPRTGNLQLVVDRKDGRDEYSAPSLWHLQMTHPQTCGDHLNPLLRLIRSDWRLEGMVSQIESALIQVALDDLTIDRQYVLELIESLRDPDYFDRQLAMRKLMHCGVGILPILDSLESSSLDSEQQHRIHQVRQKLQLATGDSPDRVAEWLSCDRAVWVSMLAHADQPKSELAREHLSRVYGQPISFEYVASDSERRLRATRVGRRLEQR